MQSFKVFIIILIDDLFSCIFVNTSWHIQGGSAVFSHVLAYRGTLRHIETYSGITEAYGAIIRYIQNSI